MSDFKGYKKDQGYQRCSEKQYDFIESLSKRLGYGHPSQAIRDAIGKNPVQGLNRRTASQVINILKGAVATGQQGRMRND